MISIIQPHLPTIRHGADSGVDDLLPASRVRTRRLETQRQRSRTTITSNTNGGDAPQRKSSSTFYVSFDESINN